jgi:hypothetical protein
MIRSLFPVRYKDVTSAFKLLLAQRDSGGSASAGAPFQFDRRTAAEMHA